jgi:hypothetical protein
MGNEGNYRRLSSTADFSTQEQTGDFEKLFYFVRL